MVESGFITPEEMALARANPAATMDRARRGSANYVADYVMDELDRILPIIEGDITVETSIDPYLQARAELALRTTLADQSDTALQGASFRSMEQGRCAHWSGDATMRKASSTARRMRSVSLVRPSSPSSIWQRSNRG